MNSHDLIILLVIAVVIVIQLIIFSSSIKKISVLRNIFPRTSFFKTVKVLIPKEIINTITPEEVFRNLNRTTGFVEFIEKESNQKALRNNEDLIGGNISDNSFYYKGAPSPDGIFKFGSSLLHTTEGVLYKFNEVNEGVASFAFVGDEKVAAAVLNDLELFVLPVCNIDNTSDNPQKIEHFLNGFATKVDINTWQVVEKASVRLV